jgi:hypothetical protein
MYLELFVRNRGILKFCLSLQEWGLRCGKYVFFAENGRIWLVHTVSYIMYRSMIRRILPKLLRSADGNVGFEIISAVTLYCDIQCTKYVVLLFTLSHDRHHTRCQTCLILFYFPGNLPTSCCQHKLKTVPPRRKANLVNYEFFLFKYLSNGCLAKENLNFKVKQLSLRKPQQVQLRHQDHKRQYLPNSSQERRKMTPYPLKRTGIILTMLSLVSDKFDWITTKFTHTIYIYIEAILANLGWQFFGWNIRRQTKGTWSKLTFWQIYASNWKPLFFFKFFRIEWILSVTMGRRKDLALTFQICDFFLRQQSAACRQTNFWEL